MRISTVCLLALGHLLIEDVPGVGKTMLAWALACSCVRYADVVNPLDVGSRRHSNKERR